MIARRLTALLLSLLMLNVTILGADSSCAEHAASGTHANSAMNEVALMDIEMAAMQPSTSNAARSVEVLDKGHQHAPCEIPSKSNCCSALVSCSVVFQTNEMLVSSSPVQTRDLIVSAISKAPVSEIVTPDPPPPKVLA